MHIHEGPVRAGCSFRQDPAQETRGQDAGGGGRGPVPAAGSGVAGCADLLFLSGETDDGRPSRGHAAVTMGGRTEHLPE